VKEKPTDSDDTEIGGGSGFGAAIATRFAEEGAKVIVADINAAGGESVAAQNPENLVFQKVDVTSPSDWAALVETAVTKFGKLDILVNNAGTTYRNKVQPSPASQLLLDMANSVQPTLEVTEAEWERVFNVNVKGIFHGTQAVIARLLEQGHGGSVINISSTGASRPRPGLVWYNASKGAVSNVRSFLSNFALSFLEGKRKAHSHRQATKGLAAEYGPHNIRVNTVSPLLSGTGLFSMFTGMEDTEENRQKFIGNVPLGRLTDPADVANMCLYLASDEGSFINGTEMLVDGGKCV
jgi:NAD(P)-dependent dehydrogenase (short-subunit alcohol dehydrogenase family)